MPIETLHNNTKDQLATKPLIRMDYAEGIGTIAFDHYAKRNSLTGAAASPSSSCSKSVRRSWSSCMRGALTPTRCCGWERSWGCL